jgi:hypothetical protein
MDIKRKTYDVRTWKKRLFLDISSTKIHTLAPSLYECVETHNIEVFWLLSQTLPHLVGYHLWLSNVLERISWLSYEPLYTTNGKHFFMNILCIESVWPLKIHNRKLLFGSTLLKHDRHFDYWNHPLSMYVHVCYQDCHEVGLCFCLVIHVENLFCPL